MSVITVSLMHPAQPVAIQSWTFEPDSVIRVGRAKDNDVVVHSSVVSRNHLELWQNGTEWEIVSFGSNGTYVNDEAITQQPVSDGMIVRLGSSGPKIQIRLGVLDPKTKIRKAGEKRSSEGTGTATGEPSKDRQTFLTGGKKTKVQEDAPATHVEIRRY